MLSLHFNLVSDRAVGSDAEERIQLLQNRFQRHRLCDHAPHPRLLSTLDTSHN